MYPAELLNLFPAYPKTNMVFVAMSFDSKFHSRWTRIFSQAVPLVEFNKNKLFAHRVDLANKNDSLITEIVKSISECRLFIADISTIGYLPTDGNTTKAIRNSNVLYEIGLAHACRLPEEVILLRSDTDQLDFDISGVRVHNYNPENIEESVRKVKSLISLALQSIDDRKHISVENTARLLDASMLPLLKEAQKEIHHPTTKNMGEIVFNSSRISTINRMLALGLLETKFQPESLNNDMAVYKITIFGEAVLLKIEEMVKQ